MNRLLKYINNLYKLAAKERFLHKPVKKMYHELSIFVHLRNQSKKKRVLEMKEKKNRFLLFLPATFFQFS